MEVPKKEKLINNFKERLITFWDNKMGDDIDDKLIFLKGSNILMINKSYKFLRD